MGADNRKPRTSSRAITVILIVFVMAGIVYSVINIFHMKAELARLEANYAQLQTTNNALHTKYNSLESTYSTLRDNYDLLENDHQALQFTFTQLEATYSQLQTQNTELATLLWQLQVDNADLQRLLEEYEQVPHDYYYSGGFGYHSNTYAELCDFLDHEFGPITSYDLDTFDCSESSAYLEWALENAGFDAQIAVGPAPWGQQNAYHAWVIVNTNEEQVAIEATAPTGWDKFISMFLFRTPGIVYIDDWLVPGSQNYYHGYDYLYDNIYQAVRHHISILEWDWWEVI